MNAVKHTPGAWDVYPFYGAYEIVADGVTVARIAVWGAPAGTPEAMAASARLAADARLIAHAPSMADLLAEISEELVEHFDVIDGPYGAQCPNWAMRLHSKIDDELRLAGVSP